MLIYQKLSSQTLFPKILKFLQNQSGEDFPTKSESLEQEAEVFPPAIQAVAELNFENTATDNFSQTTSATILIVDDTPNNLQILFYYLEKAGFKVLLAEDGISALQIARTHSPDLILLDILMPDLDGFDTCRRLKSEASTKEIPVIFLTALSETVNKVKGFKLGGVDYITKPIEQEEVVVRIQTHLHLQRAKRILTIQNKELKQALNFEALVRQITNKLRDRLEETHCLRIATEEVATVLNLSSCQIELYDSEQNTATIAYEHNITLPQSQGETREIVDFPELYQQLLQKSPVQLVEPIPQFNPRGIQVTRLACPIFDDRGIIGNLWGLKPPGELFTSLEIRLMQQVASQCAIAMRQARLYASSNQQVAELAKLNQLKDNFLRTLSHELKAPLSSIQLAAQTLESLLNAKQNPRQSPLFKRVIKIFQESCQKQKQLTEDLLTLCYVDAKAKVIQSELIDLDSLLSELTKTCLEQKIHQQKLSLDLSSKNLQIFTDRLILERIIQDLLDNALQHTPANGGITVKTELIESAVSISVINTDIDRQSGTKSGTGLGLTLVKRLAQTLKAEIEMKSTRQQTSFTIKFPAA